MKVLIIIIICFLLSGSSVFAQQTGEQTLQTLQNSPAGSKIIKLLDFIASDEQLNGDNQIEIFTKRLIDKLGTKGLNDIIKDIRINDGTLILYQADRIGRYEYHTLVKSVRNEEFLKLKIYLKEGPPYTINGFELDNVRLANPPIKVLYQPNSSGTSPVVYDGLDGVERQELKEELRQMAENKSFSGIVMLAEDWNPVFMEAVGYSNWKSKTSNTLDTKFNIGSINKFFTAVAVLQLAEEGKIKLSDSITDYVTCFSDERTKNVTIKHLLQHRSGWTMYWNNEYYKKNRENLHTIDDYMEFLKKDTLAFDPGTKQQYSNTGYVVLGAVIESVTGQSYFDYVEENIFKVADMDNTGYKTGVEGFAQGYTQRNGKNKTSKWRENTEMVGPMGNSAGGGYSTAADLLSFVEAVYGFELLAKEATRMLLNDFETGGEITDWGLGGGGLGVMALVEHDYKEGVTIIALSNVDPPSARKAMQAIQRKVF